MLDPAVSPAPRRAVGDVSAVARHAGVRSRWRPWLLVVVLGLFGALPLVVLTPPFQVPDEHQHFFRAYQLSEGQVRSEVRDGKAGSVLPSSLPEFAERSLGSRVLHAERSIAPHSLRAELAAELGRPLEPTRREFVDFTGAATYSPLAYLPQVLAIAIGRVVGAGPLALLYLGRLANALVALALVAWAVVLMPVGRRAALLAALLPMAVFLYASLSPDSAVIATAFLFTAVMARALVRDRWTTADVVTAVASGLVFCSLKPVYAPLLLLGLPAVWPLKGRANAFVANALIGAAALAAAVVWLGYASSTSVSARAGTSLAGQAAFIAGDPVGYTKLLYWTVLRWWARYYQEMIGVLGWVNIELPAFAYALPLAALPLCVPAPEDERARLSLPMVAWFIVLAGVAAFLVMTALYLGWTPVGLGRIQGVQGRYFLPLLPAFAVAFGSVARVRVAPRVAAVSLRALIAIVAVLLATTLWTVVTTYGRLG